jgi:TubC N-terminal docking domain
MTAALDLIREAEAQGRLLVEGAKLKWRSKSPIRDELLGRLREHKPEIIALLTGLGALGDPRPESRKPAAAPEPAELIAPSPWFECVARPAKGEPGLEIPAPRAAAAPETGMAYLSTFAPSAADGQFSAMALTCGQAGSVAGTAPRIGRPMQ